jgi:hypothetical protein
MSDRKLPTAGGSYIRKGEDLERVAATAPAPGRQPRKATAEAASPKSATKPKGKRAVKENAHD